MRPMRVCIYGGTDLQGTPPELIAAIADEILSSMPAVIVTGGFRHSNEKPQAISTDVAALTGARRYAKRRSKKLEECYEAWVPDPHLDRPDVKGAVRLSKADGINPRVIAGRTPLGRRLAMVADVDMVVTISGRRHTEVVVEQALELGVPVLPIPDAGGDSRDLLVKYRDRIAASFGPGELDTCLVEVSKWMGSDPQQAAKAVVVLMRTAKVGRCLVLLPYDEFHDELYASSIEPAIEKHMLPLRLKSLPHSEAIYTSFADAIQSCAAVIADITLLNENVMYEVGYAHGRGLTPLLYTRKPERLDELPVYFRTLNIWSATAETLHNLVDKNLLSVKRARSGVTPTGGRDAV